MFLSFLQNALFVYNILYRMDNLSSAQYREETEEEESKHWGVQLINNTWDFAKQKWQQLVAGKRK